MTGSASGQSKLHLPRWKSTTRSALVLGAGGGGLAIVYALVQEGVKEIVITNRSQERAEQIADIFKSENIQVRPWSERHSLVADSDLIVNTTNQGMTGQTPLELSLDSAKSNAIVADIIYVPLETSLIAEAKLGAAHGRWTRDAVTSVPPGLETLVWD